MPYRHINAAERQVIQRHRRRQNHRPLRSVVLSGLAGKWSPEAISARLCLHYPNTRKCASVQRRSTNWCIEMRLVASNCIASCGGADLVDRDVMIAFPDIVGGVRQPSFRILLCRFQGLFRIQPDRTHGFPVAGAA